MGSTARDEGVGSFLGELSVATVRAQLREGGIMQVNRGGFAKRLSWRNEPTDLLARPLAFPKGLEISLQ